MPDLFATEDVDLKKLLNGEDRDLIGRMKSILGPFILRRLKSDVMQQLVPKIQRVCQVSSFHWDSELSNTPFPLRLGLEMCLPYNFGST